MSIKNTSYSILRGLTSSISTNTVTVVSGSVKDRNFSTAGAISSATASGTTYTYTTSTGHNLSVGDLVQIAGVSASATVNAYSGTFVVKTAPSGTTFTVTGATSGPTSPATLASATFTTSDIFIPAPSTLTIGSGTDGQVSGLASTNTIYSTAAAPSSNTKRIDTLVVDYSGTTPAFGFVKGTEVALTGTASSATLLSNQIALATYAVTNTAGTTTVDPPIDQRDLPSYLPVRAFNRSQNVRIGGIKLNATSTSYIDLDDVTARKEFGYHSTVGSAYPVGSITANNSGAAVVSGLLVTPGTVTGAFTNVALGLTAGDIANRDNSSVATSTTTSFTVSSSTGTLPSGSTSLSVATSAFNVIVYADVTSAAIGYVAGAISATGSQVDPAVPVNKIALSKFTVVGNASTATITNTTDLRPRA